MYVMQFMGQKLSNAMLNTEVYTSPTGSIFIQVVIITASHTKLHHLHHQALPLGQPVINIP